MISRALPVVAALSFVALSAVSPVRAQDEDLANPEKAIKRFSEAVKKAPEDWESWYNLAFAQYKAKKYDDAATSVAKATELNDKSATAQQLAGAVAAKREKNDEAITHYEKARDIETASGDASLNTLEGLGSAYVEAGRHQDAIDVFKLERKAAEGDSAKVAAINNHIGTAYLKLGKSDEAVMWYQRNVELAPDKPQTYNNLGMTYRKIASGGGGSQFWKSSADAFKKAADMAPSDALYQFFAGEAYMMAGDYASAKPYLDKYLAADPDGKKASAAFPTGKADVYDAAHEYLAEIAKKAGK